VTETLCPCGDFGKQNRRGNAAKNHTIHIIHICRNCNQCRIAAFDKMTRGKHWVSKADHYQRLAAECLLLAKTANNQTSRITFLQMAATWLKLAERELIKNEAP
jgi:hypothetical protein